MKINDLNRELKLIYSHLIKGYSKRYFNDNLIYLKHYNETELGELEFFYAEAYNQAEAAGLPTQDQKRESFIESGEWSKEEEEEYNRLEIQIDNQERQLAQIFLESQKKTLRIELKENKKNFKKLEEERLGFTTNTCEDFASKRYGQVLATTCIYKDSSLRKKYYSDEEVEFLDAHQFIEIVRVFNKEFTYFSLKNIRRIAASSFFFNPFLHCKNNPFFIFGKPACELTIHQLNLLSYGATFKSVLEQGKTPPSSVKNIDELVDWYEVASGSRRASQGTGKATPKRETQASGLVGATKKELEEHASAVGGKVVDLNSELAKIKKEKGEVSTMDFKAILDKYK
jgi:hypothetical protein